MRPFHLILPALLLASCAGPLNKAIAKNDKALVDQALAQGADINKDAHHSVRPLYWEAPLSQAVLKKKYDMAAYLISKGALPKAGMRTAIDRDDPEAVAALLKAGAPVNDDYPYLYVAVNKLKRKVIKVLLEHGADPNRKGNNIGWYPLNVALQAGRWSSLEWDVVGQLLDAGADPGPAVAFFNKYRGSTNSTDYSGLARDLANYAAGHPGARRHAKLRAEKASAAAEESRRRAELQADLKRSEDRRLENERLQAAARAKAEADLLEQERLQRAVAAALKGAAPGATVPAPKAKTYASDVDKPAYRRAERPDDFAVVVGVEKYLDLPAAEFAGRDATAMKDHLLALGFPRRNVVLLTGSKATRSSLEKFIEAWLPRNVKPQSRVFFYFSGHGAPDVETGEAYLVPHDGDAAFLENTAYPVKRLYARLAGLKAKETIVALDACFSGAGGRSVLAKGARPLVARVDAGAGIPSSIVSFTASSGNQITTTLESQGHGIFTYFLLKGLNGAAAVGERVTARSLHDYLTPRVQDEARRQNRDQKPSFHGDGVLRLR